MKKNIGFFMPFLHALAINVALDIWKVDCALGKTLIGFRFVLGHTSNHEVSLKYAIYKI